jgi:putative ABC transport system permease protein
MTILTLIGRNIAQRRLSSILTAFSVALGVMLVCAILKVRSELSNTYRRQSEGYSLVVGPPGSALEIVLNSIYHTGQSKGFVPYSLYTEFASPRWEKYMKLAVPYAVGDSYKGFRVVATTEAVFSPEFPFPRARDTADKFSAGGPFAVDPRELEEAMDAVRRRRVGVEESQPAPEDGGHDDHDHDGDGHPDHAPGEHHHEHDTEVRAAVLGADVAERLGLAVGSKIRPAHGVESGAKDHHDHGEWTVSGVLKPTGTPIDRVVFTNIDSFYRISEHSGGLIAGTSEPGLSAVLLFPVDAYKPSVMLQLVKRTDLTVAEVASEIRRLLETVGNVDELFFFAAVLVVVVGITSILVAIYNTMNERRREVAILRAIGAHRSTIVWTIVGEAAALAGAGAAAGILLARGLLWFAAERLQESMHLRVGPLPILREEWLVIAAVLVVGALAGLIPALKAYRTEVAKHLAPTS